MTTMARTVTSPGFHMMWTLGLQRKQKSVLEKYYKQTHTPSTCLELKPTCSSENVRGNASSLSPWLLTVSYGLSLIWMYPQAFRNCGPHYGDVEGAGTFKRWTQVFEEVRSQKGLRKLSGNSWASGEGAGRARLSASPSSFWYLVPTMMPSAITPSAEAKQKEQTNDSLSLPHVWAK